MSAVVSNPGGRHPWRRWLAQALAYGMFFVPVALLAGWPPYRALAPDQAEIILSLRHSGVRLGECRERDIAELAGMPENMRLPLDCPRGRSPVRLQLDVDGERLVDATLRAQGLHADGRAVYYRRLVVPAGAVRIAMRMSDDERVPGFRYVREAEYDLAPARSLLIDFDTASGQFVFL
jgi:hypothetical protein